MVYVNISEHFLEIVQTRKSFLGKERVVASVRKELEDGVIKNGCIENKEAFSRLFDDALETAFPKAIHDKDLALAVSDEHIQLHRFTLSLPDKKEELASVVIEKAKKITSTDLTKYENFYKIIDKQEVSSEVLFTAFPHEVLEKFVPFFGALGFRVTCLSTHSFIWFYLFAPILSSGETILYVHLEKKRTEYYVLDIKGPLFVMQKPHSEKQKAVEIRQAVTKLKQENNFSLSKIILGGTGALDLPAEEFAEELHIPSVKLNEIIDSLYEKHNITVTTSGESKSVYASCVGLLALSGTPAGTNFVRDFVPEKPIVSSGKEIAPEEKDGLNEQSDSATVKKEELPLQPSTPSGSSEKKEERVAGSDESKIEEKPKEAKVEEKVQKDEEKPLETSQSQMLTQPILEYKKSFLQNVMEKKILIGIVVAVITILGIVGIGWGATGHTSLPFFPSATQTPTPAPPTPTPTITPTPTVDVKLKRTDLKVTVQNGTDTAGYAKEIGDYMEEKGYRNVVRENADVDTYTDTIIKIKEGKRNYLSLVLSDLKDKFLLATASTLDATASSDVVLILGKK